MIRSSSAEIERVGEAEVEIAGRPFRIRKEFLDDLSATNMRDAIANLGRALMVFHSPLDTTVGIDHAMEIFEAAQQPKSFISLDRADHLLSDADDARYVGSMIAAWARRFLGAPQEERKVASPGDNRVVVRTEKGYRTEILANGHPLLADEPLRVGGTNAGPTPYELLTSALGACTSITLRMYADRKGWPLDAVEVHLQHEKVHCDDCAGAEGPGGRIDRFTREIQLEGALGREATTEAAGDRRSLPGPPHARETGGGHDNAGEEFLILNFGILNFRARLHRHEHSSAQRSGRCRVRRRCLAARIVGCPDNFRDHVSCHI